MNEEVEDTVLQRDGNFAMLTWRDFNQPQPVGLSLPVVAYLIIMGAALPLLLFQ
jgi:hypothetical protein